LRSHGDGRNQKSDRSVSSRVTGYRGKRRPILVADDKADNRQILGRFLTTLGFDVSEAEDGVQAIDLTLRTQPELIFMDLVMPVKDGFETIREIRRSKEVFGEVPIVALSRQRIRFHAGTKYCRRMRGLLTKPVKLDEIVAIISQVLAVEWIYESERAPARSNDNSSVHFDCSIERNGFAIRIRDGELQGTCSKLGVTTVSVFMSLKDMVAAFPLMETVWRSESRCREWLMLSRRTRKQ